jgi:hypothetical protein
MKGILGEDGEVGVKKEMPKHHVSYSESRARRTLHKYGFDLEEHGPKAHQMGVSKEVGGGKGDNKTNPARKKADPKDTNMERE